MFLFLKESFFSVKVIIGGENPNFHETRKMTSFLKLTDVGKKHVCGVTRCFHSPSQFPVKNTLPSWPGCPADSKGEKDSKGE